MSLFKKRGWTKGTMWRDPNPDGRKNRRPRFKGRGFQGENFFRFESVQEQ